MRYAVIGSRTFLDYETLKEVLDKHYISQIVSGGAKGADNLGARYANENNIPLIEFIPYWDKYGKRAGMMRNKDIIRASDVVIAFWDNISPGTKNSLEYAKKLGKKTIIVRF